MYKTLQCFLFACGLVAAFTARAHQSSIEEFNENFPLSGEIKNALDHVNSIIPAESNQLKLFKASFASQLEVRAFACIPFLAKEETDPKNIAVLNIKLNNCLQEQDDKLLQFIGMSLVGYRLMQEPLRQLAKLGSPSPMLNLEGTTLVNAEAASKSNVALLRFTNNESIVIEIPSGKKILTLPKYSTNPYIDSLLSPNGRVTGISTKEQGLNFIDNETGDELWKAKGIRIIHAWLPELQAALVKAEVNGTTKFEILDFKTNKIYPYEFLNSDKYWLLGIPVLNISESPSRLLIGDNYYSFSQIENVRSSTGVQAKVIKEYKLVKGRLFIKPPVIMQGGKSIFFRYVSATQKVCLGLLNLNSGEEKQFETDKFLNTNNYAKLSEDEVLVTSYQHTSYFPMLWAFNINRQTLSPVRLSRFEGLVTMLSEQRWMASRNSESMLNGRSGFMYLDDKKIWVGDDVEIGKPVSLASKLNERKLETELTALEEKYGNAGVFEKEIAQKRAQIIGKIPADAKVRAIGVVQAEKISRPTDGSLGKVNVTVKKTKEPIVLLLSSFDTVRWNLVKEKGSNLVAVIVINTSEVVGAGDTKTIIRKGRNWVFEKDSPNYIALDREAISWTGKSIDEFQGARSAASFTIGK